IENESCNNLKGKSMEYDLSKDDYDWFKFDAHIRKGSDQFCKIWWGKKDMTKELDDGKWRIKSMMIGTPSDREENLDKEFDDWARDNGFVNTSGCDDVELVKK
ncbi:hypothetical protein Tco_1281088, partial [Tanacetum coccineum]